MPDPAAIGTRLAEVRERIVHAARRAGRHPEHIRLVAVSKTFDADCVRAVAAFGQVDLGENKVQEALLKQSSTSDLHLRWHLVGHLQANKARKAAVAFDVIHSIDASALAGKVDEAAAEAGRRPELLVQVNLAGESARHGAREADLPSIFEAASTMKAARLRGLMLLPPATDTGEQARPWFRELRELRDRLKNTGVDGSMLVELSMGMSHDFEIAIEEGATIVRVGTAIFGSRSGSPPRVGA